MKGMGTQGRNRSRPRGNAARAAEPGDMSGGDPPTLGTGLWAWPGIDDARARTRAGSRILCGLRIARRSLALIMPAAPQWVCLFPTEEADLDDRPRCGPLLAYRIIRL